MIQFLKLQGFFLQEKILLFGKLNGGLSHICIIPGFSSVISRLIYITVIIGKAFFFLRDKFMVFHHVMIILDKSFSLELK